MKRYLAIGIGMLVVVMIVVPTIFVMLGSNEDASEVSQVFDMNTAKEKAPPLDEIPNQLKVSVYRTKQKKVETLKLEPYVAGVVAAEMPAISNWKP